jgi:hypothetical protein
MPRLEQKISYPVPKNIFPQDIDSRQRAEFSAPPIEIRRKVDPGVGL